MSIQKYFKSQMHTWEFVIFRSFLKNCNFLFPHKRGNKNIALTESKLFEEVKEDINCSLSFQWIVCLSYVAINLVLPSLKVFCQSWGKYYLLTNKWYHVVKVIIDFFFLYSVQGFRLNEARWLFLVTFYHFWFKHYYEAARVVTKIGLSLNQIIMTMLNLFKFPLHVL